MRILFIGDIMGRPGRKAVPRVLPSLREKHGSFDFIIANGENSAAGFGLTETVMNELFSMGIDVITSGNHVWDKKDILPLLDSEKRILRPANHPEGTPGRGFGIFEKNGKELAVISLPGAGLLLPPPRLPFPNSRKTRSRKLRHPAYLLISMQRHRQKKRHSPIGLMVKFPQ